ncbi:hypothetical protein FAZ19_06355 [Sphingobacterium alkalisoli]|uniref:Uncharacterized protein n=1 Tax=Sphingobacterium alkalisoli TaxID=1874115 RepID=A0A4U0H4D2_9SPHI|nr:hypothetical protein [Sphingobacterium alkalisoli]TJY66541.1 hypothetical protein FAZ19_06355 [Sphingobacterium alkalisoli]GGH15762.1 hypothetical protein GCM10011418_17690 [Sphingobacterium alkalisoli]
MEKKKKSKDIDSDFLSIKSLFESGIIKSMRLLESQAPTNMAKALGLNYNSYLDKLQHPDKFTFRHIFKMANLCNLDADLIYELIKKQTKHL